MNVHNVLVIIFCRFLLRSASDLSGSSRGLTGSIRGSTGSACGVSGSARGLSSSVRSLFGSVSNMPRSASDWIGSACGLSGSACRTSTGSGLDLSSSSSGSERASRTGSLSGIGALSDTSALAAALSCFRFSVRACLAAFFCLDLDGLAGSVLL